MAFLTRVVSVGVTVLVACGDQQPDEPIVETATQAVSGQDNTITVSSGNVVVNQYSALTASAAAGTSVLSVNSIAELDATSIGLGTLAPGDELMVIQMQGATISTANDATYGTITALGNTGNYELVIVQSITNNDITIISDCGGLRSSYTVNAVTGAKAQVVRVPQPQTLTVSGTGKIVPLAWSGTRGGVVAVHVGGTATIGGNGIDAGGFGFRGGAVDSVASNGNTGVTFRSTNGANGGEKGEGIAGDQAFYDSTLQGKFSRGAPANGGGGGNGEEAGGGGGANGDNGNAYNGAGVMDGSATDLQAWALDPDDIAAGGLTNSSGGGRGGYTHSSSNQNALTLGPGQAAWLSDLRRNNGGRGGHPLANNAASKLFMGGGGGAGDGNGGGGGAGGNGGGIVLLIADTVTGTGAILSKGQPGNAANRAGPGGGGGGGAIVVRANTLSGITANADGGFGGLASGSQDGNGPGGGGGGGFIAFAGGSITTSAIGVAGGTTSQNDLSEFPKNGATKGATGVANASAATLSGCFADLSISLADSPDPVSSGAPLTYTISTTNAGPAAASTVSVVQTLPAGESFVSATGTGWACSFSAPTVTCTRASAAVGAQPAISVVVNVTLGSGSLSTTATISTATAELSTTNNSDTEVTTVNDVNDPPVNAVPGPQTTPEDTTFAIPGVSIADDAGANPVKVTLSVTNGALTIGTTGLTFIVGDGTADATMTFTGTIGAINTALGGLLYIPTANFNGTSTFTILTDDQGNTGSGGPKTDTDTVQITVTPVNDPPNALDDIRAVNEDSGATAMNVLTNDTFAPDSGETLTITAVTQPANGTAAIVGGGTNVNFTPGANFNGSTSFTYTISDGNGGTDTATVSITVNPVNDPPNAVDDSRTVAEDSGATAMNVLTNDTFAPDVGETLTITAVTQPANGSAVIVGGTNINFTPAANFNGSTSFTYTLSDGNGGTDTATVTVTVTSVNDPPDAINDTKTIAEDSGPTVITVLANDIIAPDVGETLTITAVSTPAQGTTAITGGGTTVTFTPNANFNGTAAFTYTISDGNGGTDTATVTVTVTAANDPPTANPDSKTVFEDSAATTITVLANDSFAPDVGETLSVTAVTQPANGMAAVVGGTSVSFTPSPNFNGTTTFNYTLSDGNGGTATGLVTVTVTPVNDPPTLAADTAQVDEDTVNNVIDVLATDSSAPDGAETLTVTAVTQPATGGTSAVGGGGANVTFTPAANFSGVATFSYTVSDGNGGVANASVSVTVMSTNDPPTAKDDHAAVQQGAGATAINVLANDTALPDVGETLSITSVTQGAKGVVAITGGGTGLTYDPTGDFAGIDTFTYTIDDGTGMTATATVTVAVGPDSDGDGLPDPTEVAIGTNPNDADSDDDGVKDGAEPDFDKDTDGDGLINALDPDSDNDGIYDGTELGITSAGGGTDPSKGHFIADADSSTKTDPLKADTDNGGVSDGAEDVNRNGKKDAGETDPNNPADDGTPADTDGDGLTDAQEVALGTDPDDADSDDDGVLDGDEPNFADDTDGDTLINALDPDSDGDQLKDGTELGITTADPDTNVGAGNFVPDADPATHTSAVSHDTDHGGVDDGEEDTNHDGAVDTGERDPTDPGDDHTAPSDMDGDGILDGGDNCANTPNPDQQDTDNDGIGDACDPDSNNDGINDGLSAGGGGCSAGGGAGLAVALAIGVMLRRRRRELALLAVLVVPKLAAAQSTGEPRDFGVERFQLASDRLGLLGVEWAEGRSNLAIDVGMWLGYANDPLVIYNDADTRVGPLVSDRTAGGLVASVSPAPWVTLGLELPVVLSQDRPQNMTISDMLLTLQGSGTGDLRLIPKLTMLTQKQNGIGLAIIPVLYLPTLSSKHDYLADKGAAIAPELDLSRSIPSWRFAGNFGYHARHRTELLDLVVDDEIFARLGTGFRFADKGGPPVGLDAALSMAVAAKDPFGSANQTHVEGLFGASVGIAGTAVVFAGVGFGFDRGFGTPDYRVLGGVRLGSKDRPEKPPEPEQPKPDEGDDDHDGVLNWRDNCRLEPEDKDGYKDEDGCPDPDNDGDKIADADDKCPNEAGIAENHGCPSQDADVDGVPDHEDKCPNEAEDFDGFEDEDGCPEPDNDKDGVLDAQDLCPNVAGPADAGGCPDPDRDGDGVVDRFDNCPDEKGAPESAGCTKPQLVVITPVKIAVKEQIQYNRAAISQRSYKLLDNLAAVMVAHPKLVVEVGVHTEALGDEKQDKANKELSQQRADAVVVYLVKKGVDAQHVISAGFGGEQPEADNSTKQGREQNRRTVFKVIGGTKPEAPPKP